MFGFPNPYAVLIWFVLAAGIFASGVGIGYKVRGADADRERADAVEEQLAYTAKEIARGNELERELEKRKSQVRSVERVLTAGVDRVDGCPRGSGLTHYVVRLHDAAATSTGDVPQATSSLACQATPFTNADLARTVVHNYADCNEYRAQLTALIDWIEGQ